MNVAAELLELARSAGCTSLAVVGTSKNAGKTVVIGALLEELWREGTACGLASIGRDGEAVDALGGFPKPRLALRRGVLFATAAALLPRHPAVEVVARTSETSALGPIVLAAMREPGTIELAGPPQAAALRRIAVRLARERPFVLIDGAVDRIAALRDADDAVVVSVGAATASTPALAVEAAQALVARLRLRRYDPGAEAVFVRGALTLRAASEFARTGLTRQIVVRDGTHIAFGGRALLGLATRLDLRCERALRPVACTVAPLAHERRFEPRAFLRDVALATGLPAFDVFAGAAA